jgi:hypothetical protein
MWHWSGVVHATDVPGAHTPALHTSFCVQALLSALHGVLSALLAYVQVPLVALHVPGSMWHWSGVAHTTDVPGVHTPALHTSA